MKVSSDVWFFRYEAQQTNFFVIRQYFVILGPFLPFDPPKNPKIKI